MTSSEQSKVLKMIEDGKISAEEGLRLMQVLGEEKAKPAKEPTPLKSSKTPPPDPVADADPAIAETASKARGLWMIPLWIGVGITILGGWVMYLNIHPTAISAWFYCLGFPIFLLGVAITALGWSSRTARWLFVRIEQPPGEFPRRIVIGFPLPLRLTSWFLRTFGHHIPELRNVPISEMIDAVEVSEEPLIVNVNEGEDGEKVQVFIG